MQERCSVDKVQAEGPEPSLRTHIKKQASCNYSKSQNWKGGDRQILAAHRPTNLALVGKFQATSDRLPRQIDLSPV